MSKRQPMRQVMEVKMEKVGVHEMFGGGEVFMVMDHLSCDHNLPAEYLKSPSKTSYTNKEDGTTWRKCRKCPREKQ